MKKFLAFMMIFLFSASLAFSQGGTPQSTPPEKVVIEYKLVTAIANYLQKQPYDEVERLLYALKNGLSSVPKCPEEVKDEAKGAVKKQVVPKKEETPAKTEKGK